MPWTLYGYILRDIVKVLALTTAVLITVISFVVAIKPLSDGLLGPGELVKFVGYSMPTMLTFVLPFAAAFASTVVFVRLAGDNELVACRAGGMSYATILLPVLLLGTVLMLALLGLSNFAIPHFYQGAKQMVEKDVMSAMLTQLNQNQPFEYGRFVIYADGAVEYELTAEDLSQLPDDPPPSLCVLLDGVAVLSMNDDGGVTREATAASATVLLYRRYATDESWVQIILDDAVAMDLANGRLAQIGRQALRPLPLPSRFNDNPSFLSWTDLRELGKRRYLFDAVRNSQRELAKVMAKELLVERLVTQLDSNGIAVLSSDTGVGQARDVDASRSGQQYQLNVPLYRMEATGLALRAGDERDGAMDRPVVVERLNALGEVSRRYEAASGFLRLVSPEIGVEPMLELELDEVRLYTVNLRGEKDLQTEHRTLRLPMMRWVEPILPLPAKTEQVIGRDGQPVWTTDQLETLGQQYELGDSPAVINASQQLTQVFNRLGHMIIAQHFQRAASALACLLLAILGAVLSIKLAGKGTLAVFFWSMLLALLTIILINSGERLTSYSDDDLLLPILTLSSGNIVILIVIFVLYLDIRRT